MPRKPAKKKRPQRRRITKKAAFLTAFRACCDITEAAARIGVNRSFHYDAMRADPKYAASFEAAIEEAAGNLDHEMAVWSNKGVFVPTIYQGEYCYARRMRVLCKLADGTNAYADELPAGAEIVDRKTVSTTDGGEQIGTWVRSERIALARAAAWLPQRYGKKVELTGKDGVPLVPDEIRVTFESDPESEALRPLDHDPEVSAPA